MTAPHARCESCGVSLPPNAFRCPTCGHQQGEEITIEVGRRAGKGPRTLSPHRRRDLIALGSVVALVVAGLVFVGRDSGSSPSAAANTTTTTTPRTTTSSSSTTSTSTTIATTTTATTVPGSQLGELSGISLLIATEERSVSLIDLDSGATSRALVDAGMQWVARAGGLVVSTQTSHVNFLPPPYDKVGVDLGLADGFFPSSFDDRVWLIRYAEQITLTEVDVTGAITAGPFMVPQAQVAGAVNGGIVLSLHGSIYLFDRTGSARRIASGDAVAAGGDSVFAGQCDEHFACGVVLINLATGSVRAVPEVADAVTQGLAMTFSPDGTVATVLLSRETEPTSLVVVDLATAGVSILEQAVVGFSPTTPCFSADSQWLFFTTGLETTAYRLGTDEKRKLSLGGKRISSLVAV